MVLVGLVGADHDFDVGIEVHPGDIRGVVVVGHEGFRPQLEESAQAFVVCGMGRRNEFSRSNFELLAVGRRVGQCDQAFALPANDGEEGGECLAVRRMGLDPRLELTSRHVLRVVAGAVRMGLFAEKRFVVNQPVPRTVHDAVVIPHGLRSVTLEGRDFRRKSGISGPRLQMENLVHRSRCSNQVLERLAVAF